MRAARILKFAVLAIVAVFLFGFIVMSLWNWLMPAVFNLHTVTFCQALGLLILGKILFGGFRGGPGGHWRHRMRERWDRLTPEERERFRDAMRKRYGCVDERFEEKPTSV